MNNFDLCLFNSILTRTFLTIVLTYLETSPNYFVWPPSLCSILIIANIWNILHIKNEKMLLFWPVSYNDPVTLGFTPCVTCSLCLLLLFRSLKQHFPALCFYTQHCLFLVTLILLCPSWLSLQSFTDFQLFFSAWCSFLYAKKELDWKFLNTRCLAPPRTS